MTSLLARRRLAKAAAILNDPDHPQHTLLADLVDAAIALDPPADFVPWMEPDPCPATLANRQSCTCEGQCLNLEPDPCPPSGITRPRRGGLIVRLPG